MLLGVLNCCWLDDSVEGHVVAVWDGKTGADVYVVDGETMFYRAPLRIKPPLASRHYEDMGEAVAAVEHFNELDQYDKAAFDALGREMLGDGWRALP